MKQLHFSSWTLATLSAATQPKLGRNRKMSVEATTSTLTAAQNLDNVLLVDLLWIDEVIVDWCSYCFDARVDSIDLL